MKTIVDTRKVYPGENEKQEGIQRLGDVRVAAERNGNRQCHWLTLTELNVKIGKFLSLKALSENVRNQQSPRLR
jgi:hypothetical protein